MRLLLSVMALCLLAAAASGGDPDPAYWSNSATPMPAVSPVTVDPNTRLAILEQRVQTLEARFAATDQKLDAILKAVNPPGPKFGAVLPQPQVAAAVSGDCGSSSSVMYYSYPQSFGASTGSCGSSASSGSSGGLQRMGFFARFRARRAGGSGGCG